MKKYPSLSQYVTCIKNPRAAFAKRDEKTGSILEIDSLLVSGQPLTKKNGTDLWLIAGGCSCVFKYQTEESNLNSKELWAVKCFTQNIIELEQRYEDISRFFEENDNECLHYLTKFEFKKEGIRVNGELYPTFKMKWLDSEPLKDFLKNNLNNKPVLKSLADSWRIMCRKFASSGIAHGDLHHGNILISNNGVIDIKLIDYDSLYCSKYFSARQDCIKGLSGYQHPARKNNEKQLEKIDFFSQIVIYISIIAIAEKPELWDLYDLDNTERLLFSEKDFYNPQKAQIFYTLSQLKSVYSLANVSVYSLVKVFKDICMINKLENIFSLEEAIEQSRKYDRKSIIPMIEIDPISPYYVEPKDESPYYDVDFYPYCDEVSIKTPKKKKIPKQLSRFLKPLIISILLLLLIVFAYTKFSKDDNKNKIENSLLLKVIASNEIKKDTKK